MCPTTLIKVLIVLLLTALSIGHALLILKMKNNPDSALKYLGLSWLHILACAITLHLLIENEKVIGQWLSNAPLGSALYYGMILLLIYVHNKVQDTLPTHRTRLRWLTFILCLTTLYFIVNCMSWLSGMTLASSPQATIHHNTKQEL